MRSLPENSATKRPGASWRASESAASRSPAAHPSVRSCRRPTSPGSTARPAAASSSPASSAVKCRSAARISSSSPVSRSRCRPSFGSRRLMTIVRSCAGVAASSCSSPSSASAARSSCRSSTTSITGPRQAVEPVEQAREELVLPARGRGRQRGERVVAGNGARGAQRVHHRRPEADRIGLPAVDAHPADVAGAVQPRRHEHRLAASRGRADQGHPPRAVEHAVEARGGRRGRGGAQPMPAASPPSTPLTRLGAGGSLLLFWRMSRWDDEVDAILRADRRGRLPPLRNGALRAAETRKAASPRADQRGVRAAYSSYSAPKRLRRPGSSTSGK